MLLGRQEVEGSGDCGCLEESGRLLLRPERDPRPVKGTGKDLIEVDWE